jgi:ribulose-5-phosphate 4-epimerase/fuculose-1-phosphate aldolase
MSFQAVQSSTPSVEGAVSPEEWETRIQLAAAYRLIHRYGMATTLIFNHISARVPGADHHFLLNPYGLAYDEVTASSLIKVDLEGNIVAPTEYGLNRAGFMIHGAIHGARPDVACVLHTHTESGMAVSCLEDGFLFVNQEALMFYDDLVYHDFEGIVLDGEECPRLVASLGDKNNLVLRNHGLLTVGDSVAMAFIRMFFLEKSCVAQLKAQATGGAIRPIPSEVCQRTADQHRGGNDDYLGLAWTALLRELDRADIDYRR